MRIKKLEISGFKSFAERARLHFGEGITGVVGPNGCGKSNVVDAIRWVMGEMSAKHLRGRGMQDVIFAGSDGRGAQSMAEVTLTFDNDGNVPPAYLSYGEIAVTRRLFRDGTSEYLINKSPVRLRDITDLFLGTGVGTRAYSIIEQGRIGFVVNSRPEERRSLIEEVAGITKFKVRKKAAERRMEATQQNLARVGDVVGELERQLVTLRRQAKKAEAYRDLRAQLRERELQAASLELLRLHQTRLAHEAEVVRLAEAIGDSQRANVADESALEGRKLQLLAQEKALMELQEASAVQDAKLGGLERDLTHWREQVRQLQLQRERSGQDAAEAEEAFVAGQAELQRLAQDLAAHEAGAGQDAHEIDAATALVDEAGHEVALLDDELAVARREAMAQVQGAVQQQAALTALERERNDAEAALQARRREADTLAPELAALVARQEMLEAEQAALEQTLEALRTAQAQAQEALPLARAARAAAQRAAQQAAEAHTTRSSRLASLRQIVQRLEGYSDGVRHLYGEGEAKLPGVRALVAELFAAPPAHEQAIEAALGERLQYLVVDDEAVAVRGVAALQEAGGGRSGFVPHGAAAAPVPADTAEAALGAVDEAAGIFGRAPALLQVAPEHAALVEALLGHTVLVRELSVALEEAAKASARGWTDWRWVTPEGTVVDGQRIVTGGAASQAGLLANRREVRELQDEVAKLAQARQDAEAALTEAEAEVGRCEAALQRDDAALHGEQLRALEVRKNLEAVRAGRERDAARLAQVQAEAERRRGELDELMVREAEVRTQAEAAQAGRDEGAYRLEELEERRAVQASRLAEHQEALVALKVQLASAKERGLALAQARNRLEAQLPALQARIGRASQLADEVAQQLGSLHAQIDAGAAQLEDYAQGAQDAKQTLIDARGAYEEAQAALMHSEQALKELRRDANGLQEALVQARMQQQKLELAQQTLEAQVQERHDVALRDVVERYHHLPQPSAADKKAQAEMERQLRAMGAVNLTAIEECAEVEGRYTFLRGQQEDLQAALAALQQAILRINKTSRERFQEAFDAVNATFQKVYPRLFHGGSARLELIAADDLLESGVDIIAMPPGKKLQNVSLLSGGEKALTATALVFAIFLIKPSPFCILDEVDAPLDEANVGRFNEMLREISKISQFIVITHNKQTMLQMDRLYGITMEDAGMSKVVAVDLQNRRDTKAA